MGEDLTDKRYYSRDETVVFWNLDDYPIPSGADRDSIYPNIELALHKMGFHGRLSIMADDKHDLSRARMYREVKEELPGDGCCVRRMTRQILSYASLLWRVNIMVVAKAKEKQCWDLPRVLDCLKSRDIIVLLLEPPPGDTAQPFLSVDSVVESTQVFGGVKPISGMLVKLL
ncbi:PREDICTED: uncharacterized protein LOC104710616 [Camelina sativa]|uniref:Uncharacterized protein LOC104710616 n=1 Tax=Camelina sativa TaxID=90675 RepID=A0ABM0TF97_CAMSA|nr:PREDICTED: uncharacterized protein LOC104710616 [Camelina sativa]